MILYFSGTGNSRFAAEIVASVTGDTVVSLNERIKNGIKEPLCSAMPFVFVCPTYAWRLPKIVEDHLSETRLEGSRKAYFILTCGSETENASGYAKKLCRQMNLTYCGLASVVMPENYIAMFKVPDRNSADAILKKSIPQVLSAAEVILGLRDLPEESPSLAGRFFSRALNPVFYRFAVNAKGFWSTPACTGCGVCARLCPLNNVMLADGRPRWGNRCTHCMACICGCPAEAIEYKNASKGKPRYYNTRVYKKRKEL
jgi:ferredoxin